MNPLEERLRIVERDWDELRRQNNQLLELNNALRARVASKDTRLRQALTDGLALSGGWREAIIELQDFCPEPVRLKNMMAATDQLDEWCERARAALDA